MLEIITRRRLIVFLFAALFVTLSILFFGRIIPSYSNYSSSIKTEDKQEINECYLSEPVDVLSLCQKCTSYERRSKAVGCSPSGYREYVNCSKSNIKVYRSCPIPAQIQKQHFWLFEGFIFFIGLLSIASVHSRQKILDKQMVEKIKRQIGESEE